MKRGILIVAGVFFLAFSFWIFRNVGNPFVSYPKCPAEDVVVSIPDYPGIRVEADDNRIHPDLLPKLEYAGRVAQDFQGNSYELVINSAFRDYKEQLKMLEDYKKGKGNAVIPPEGCVSGHMQGYAIDVCMVDQNNPQNTICNYVNQESNGVHPLMQTMQEIMQSAGFSRYCGEWWHFEGYPMPNACPPGIYTKL